MTQVQVAIDNSKLIRITTDLKVACDSYLLGKKLDLTVRRKKIKRIFEDGGLTMSEERADQAC